MQSFVQKATFNGFVNSSPMLSGLAGNDDAENIFNIINSDEQISGAVSASKNGMPALLSSVRKIEEYVQKNPDSDFPMTDFNKQAIGRMQKFVLEPFGYSPVGDEKPVKKPVKSKIFKTASCYEYVDGKTAIPVPSVKTPLRTKRSEEELRKAYIEDGDFGAMFELFELYKETGEEDKSIELIDIYMNRGDYLWLQEAEEAMMEHKENHE